MPRKVEASRRLQKRAEQMIPGGVNSPVRAFGSVGGDPLFIVRGLGSHLWDADQNKYIDYVGSWGPLILGHAAPGVPEAVSAAAKHGTSFGASTPAEADLAEIVISAFPHVEKDADALLVKAGSGVATLGIPGSAGVPEEFTQLTLALPFNDIDTLERAFKKFEHQIACVIVEPVVGNMGCVPPAPLYLDALREITLRDGALLILDEVMTGFRLAFGGAQERYGILPDLTTFGKIIGGGLPVGAYGGPREIMDMVAPLGPVYQAGTLSGNPLAMAAGLATLRYLRSHKNTIYASLELLSGQLVEGVAAAAKEAGVSICYNRVGSMFTWFFTPGPVTDWTSASKCDTAAFGRFFRAMLDNGIYLPPSQFEAAFLSAAHTGKDVEQTIAAARQAFAAVNVG